MVEISDVVSRNISWLSTMKQKGGYCGPVVHYWHDCLNYIGPGLDWRYEGLIIGFLNLYERTKSECFLDMAVEAGDHLLSGQLRSGNFFNSNFEGNISLRGGATPHEPAACIGLLCLAEKLKSLCRDWKPYFLSAKRNMDDYHLKVLWDEDAGAFLQYRYDRVAHVPNKVATIVEFLLKLFEFTKDKKYLSYAVKCGDFIVSQQDLDEYYGGIYQSDGRRHIITYYTARCVPALLKLSDVVGDEKYRDAALCACKFITGMENKSGGFDFGYLKNDSGTFRLYKYPVWVAGSCDIIRALLAVEEYKRYSVRRNLRWVLDNVNENGSFRTSYGMNLRNKLGTCRGKPFWRDVLPVVGWNDKALRLFSMLVEEGVQIPEACAMEPIEVECRDALFYEDSSVIEIKGDENYMFRKDKMYSSNNFLKSLLLSFGKYYTLVNPGFYGVEAKIYSRIS